MSKIQILIGPQEVILFSDVKQIYNECKWGWPGDALAQQALNASYRVVIAYREGLPIGFARAISDGVAYALIVDTMVVPSSQNAGVGKKIMQALLAALSEGGVAFAKLISSKEGKPFYEKLGFQTRSSDEPGMILPLK